jgi:hypothetical protein
MYDLGKLEAQLAQYVMQKSQHQEMFHKLCGAIEVLLELINGIKSGLEAKDNIDGQTDSEDTQQPSEE